MIKNDILKLNYILKLTINSQELLCSMQKKEEQKLVHTWQPIEKTIQIAVTF